MIPLDKIVMCLAMVYCLVSLTIVADGFVVQRRKRNEGNDVDDAFRILMEGHEAIGKHAHNQRNPYEEFFRSDCSLNSGGMCSLENMVKHMKLYQYIRNNPSFPGKK
ncbi:hypothetical protein HELRODRAFT_168962 [Helobdella robusta]|uniref:Uncharacterized protein n=1 Tax=Helobdella robusta TaxID=6412 RepID=T1F173_HELRO|nr:hypothetical protein HELRODRAFT_168962 [Helobdella robusta]ESO09028.1 hypothetical protein HELRODRAFT_168962 [Helobdella robusta]